MCISDLFNPGFNLAIPPQLRKPGRVAIVHIEHKPDIVRIRDAEMHHKFFWRVELASVHRIPARLSVFIKRTIVFAVAFGVNGSNYKII